MPKIIDRIIERRKRYALPVTLGTIEEAESSSSGSKTPPVGWYYSFEFFPPKTEAGLDNLFTRIDRMTRRLDPLFVSCTWGSNGSTSAKSMAIVSHAQRYGGVDALLHLSATGMSVDQITTILQQARTNEVCNILVLRGDPPQGKRSWARGDVSGGACDRAIDLVKLIRKLHGDYFGIAVAGHPEGHPSSYSPEDEMLHLKEKVDAGADLIITQFFYDCSVFSNFVRRCRDVGIDCPIMPGIMPIQSHLSLVRMSEYCDVSVPTDILKRIDAVKDDDQAVKNIGVDIAVSMCRQILESGDADGVHFYTLNLERSASKILFQLGAVSVVEPPAAPNEEEEEQDMAPSSSGDPSDVLGTSPGSSIMDVVRSATDRELPWRKSALPKRAAKEDVRPINWANRPKSYVMRTEYWDDFPNGRWGDATSPAFGELSDLSHFYSFSLGTEDERKDILGYGPKKEADVNEVFAKYVEGKLRFLPWCEMPLQPESFAIQKQLANLNRYGLLTVNSQPAVNGLPSNHKSHGWGGPGGYVYQKEYCECFCSPERAEALLGLARSNPQIHLYAVNADGKEMRQGMDGVTALTWGVFPGKEILQPTIFEPSTFLVWSQEAFALWSHAWSSLYEFESRSYALIESIRSTYYLVALINNDYISSAKDPDSTLWSLLEQTIKS